MDKQDFGISLEQLNALIASQVTRNSLDFTLECNLEDPSRDEENAFNTGANAVIWLLRKGVDPSFDS